MLSRRELLERIIGRKMSIRFIESGIQIRSLEARNATYLSPPNDYDVITDVGADMFEVTTYLDHGVTHKIYFSVEHVVTISGNI